MDSPLGRSIGGVAVEKVMRLVGRDDAIVLIRAYMDRPQVNGRRYSRPRPALILEGSRGSGKSALLEVMSTLLVGR